MKTIINSIKCCFPKSQTYEDQEAQISYPVPLNKQTTGFTANTALYSNDQKNKSKINLDQGEKHYSFKVSENLFSTIILQKQNELNHINSINSENLYAMTCNRNESKESPNVLDSHKNIEDKDKGVPMKMGNNAVPDKDIEDNKTLRLEDHEGSLLNGKTLSINAGGLNGSKRQMKDGYTFFGSILKKDNVIINDYIINQQLNSDNNEKSINRNKNSLFAIFFELKTQTYYIKEFNENNEDNLNDMTNRLLMQVIDQFTIDQESYFSFCMSTISIKPIENNESILISILDTNNTKEFTFNKSNNPEVTIGRKKSCDVHIQTSLVSKIHCTINYDTEKNVWIITDGHKNKKSTNGLWYYIKTKHPINQEVSFVKIGTNIIKITIIDN